MVAATPGMQDRTHLHMGYPQTLQGRERLGDLERTKKQAGQDLLAVSTHLVPGGQCMSGVQGCGRCPYLRPLDIARALYHLADLLIRHVRREGRHAGCRVPDS